MDDPSLSGSGVNVFLILFFVLANGFFVASEFALVTVRRSWVETLAGKGDRRAKILLQVISDLDNYIAATQLGITIASLALDPFFLWVNEESQWKTAQDFVAAARAGDVTVAGTGAKQEDEVLFTLIQQKAGTRAFRYVPQAGGGGVAAALAGNQVQATVNNPSEGLSFYEASPRKLRPICTFSNTSPGAGPFKGLATCKSQGLDVGIEYFIMRSVMGPPGLRPDQVKFHVDLLKKVYDSAEWKEFAEKNVLDLKFVAGEDFKKFLGDYNKLHEDVMKQAGWVQ